jgi:hypothetical protein
MKNPLRRLIERVLAVVAVPPARPGVEGDGVLEDLDRLSPEEREARLRVWHTRTRRGRGDGGG